MLVLYLFAALFIIIGVILIRFGTRKRTPKEVVSGKELQLTGRGSKGHHIGLGIIFLILAIIILFKIEM
jgi:hypothetical protein